MSAVSYEFKRDYNELDPQKKKGKEGLEWADRLVRQFRIMAEPLVDNRKAAINRSYLYGVQDVKQYKDRFKQPDDLPFKFEPLKLFEKYRNILTAEREKAGIYIQLNALDPTAQQERDYDKKLLTNASFIEGVASYMNYAKGLPKFDLSQYTKPDGQKPAKGNLDTFKEMQLDPNNSSDIAYFFRTHWRLNTEAEAEDAVNYFIRLNTVQEYIKDWCDDIMACKAICGRTYTDEMNFTPKDVYIKPEYVKWIPGQGRDGRDAKCIMVEENMTVGDFLSRTATKITAENVKQIIDSVNYIAGTAYDGIAFSNGATTEGCTNSCNYDQFLSMKIGVGYVEWKSVDATVIKKGITPEGNFHAWEKAYEWKPSEDSGYERESIFNMVTYKAYYVMHTSGTHTIVKFGKLFNMETYGPEDEYSAFSFQIYKEAGPTAIDVCKQFIDNAHDAWYKFNWIMLKAKPSGRSYNYNVIAKIASKVFKEDPEENGVMKVISMFQDSINDFYVNDSLNANVGGGQNPHFELKNGMDDAVKDLYEIFKAQQELMSEKLGINAIREAYSPNPNDGYKLQMQTLQQSRNASEYISRMIMSVLNHKAKSYLNIVQGLIEFKGSQGYENIERALGIKSIWSMQALKRMPLHKFGIMVESFNTDIERAELKQEAKEAWLKGEIPYHVYLLVRNIDNYKKAAQTLAYEKAKEVERKQQEAEKAHTQKMEADRQMHEMLMQRLQFEQDGKMALQDKVNEGIIAAAEIQADSRRDVKQMQVDSEPMKSQVRTQSRLAEEEGKKRIERGEPRAVAEI